VPYFSWSEGGLLRRHEVEAAVQMGRDPVLCPVCQPTDPSVSRTHALVAKVGGQWWIRDLESRNGTILNGLAVSTPIGSALEDGDEIELGDWCVKFTEGFPGLDGVSFIEGVGDLFSEIKPEPGQALVLVRVLELLHRSTESLLEEGSANAMFRRILTESLDLLRAGLVAEADIIYHGDPTDEERFASEAVWAATRTPGANGAWPAEDGPPARFTPMAAKMAADPTLTEKFSRMMK